MENEEIKRVSRKGRRANVDAAVPEALEPTGFSRVTQQQFSDNQRAAGTRYGLEMFKDDYYRIVHSSEEHYKMLMDGWSEDKPEGHAYLPFASSPEAVDLAKTQLDAKADKERQEALAKSAVNGTVSLDQVEEMVRKGIAAALSAAPTVFAQSRETASQAKRGPGRPRQDQD